MSGDSEFPRMTGKCSDILAKHFFEVFQKGLIFEVCFDYMPLKIIF